MLQISLFCHWAVFKGRKLFRFLLVLLNRTNPFVSLVILYTVFTLCSCASIKFSKGGSTPKVDLSASLIHLSVHLRSRGCPELTGPSWSTCWRRARSIQQASAVSGLLYSSCFACWSWELPPNLPGMTNKLALSATRDSPAALPSAMTKPSPFPTFATLSSKSSSSPRLPSSILDMWR